MRQTPTRRLIVTADDFGLTESIDAGILHACRNGIVNAVSLIPTGRSADQALELARKSPGLMIGVHLCLTQTAPLLPPRKVATLVRPNGCFNISWPGVLARILSGRLSIPELEREWRTQIEWFFDRGVCPSHLDSHQHVHFMPWVRSVVARLSRDYQIPRVRVLHVSPFQHFSSRGGMPESLLSLRCWGLWAASLAASSRLREFRQSRCCWGLTSSGKLTQPRLQRIIQGLPLGIHELLCHPGWWGKDCDELQRLPEYRWLSTYHHEQEVDCLTSQATFDTLAECGVGLMTADESIP